jgi:hypothetical protein
MEEERERGCCERLESVEGGVGDVMMILKLQQVYPALYTLCSNTRYLQPRMQ